MFRRPVKEINAEYRAEERALPAIQNLVRESCINAGMSRKDVGAVILAIEEGVTNIIRHAYIYEEGQIRIRIIVYNKRIVFSLIDSGRSFQPEGDAKLDLKKMAESGRKGGLGFYMISKIMDSIEYLSTPGFNELRMTKLISRQPEIARLMMGRMFSLRVKFSIYTFIIMLTIIAGAYLFINNRTTQNIHNQLHEMVASLSGTIADQADGYILNRRSDVEFNDLVRSYMRANPEVLTVVLIDRENNILADTRGYRNLHRAYILPPEVIPDLAGQPQKIKIDDKEVFYIVNTIQSDNNIRGEVHITYTGRMMDEMLGSERTKIIILTIIGLAFGILGIYLLSDYFVSPIIRIVERVRRFSSGDFETELPLEGVEEYFEISKALNEMMNRLRRDHENIIERERVAKEIEVAGQIQKTLLPADLPSIPCLKLDAYYRAASRISGDLYDVFRIDADNYCFLVADVSGKGIPASLIMSVLRTVIRILAREKKSSHEILVAVDDYIRVDIPAGIFITIFLAVYNCREEQLNFVSAGHNPLIYYDRTKKKVSHINPAGVPLGLPLDEDRAFANKLIEQKIKIAEGDLLFVYSDGITEAMNRNGEGYGLERLTAVFNRLDGMASIKNADQITKMVLSDIDSHCGMATQADDITFITIMKSSSDSDNGDNIETASIPSEEE